MVVKLDLAKAISRGLIIDRNKFFVEHDGSDTNYKLLAGTPLIICIEGHYINVDDLPNLVVDKRQGFVVNEWVASLKRTGELIFLNYEWRR